MITLSSVKPGDTLTADTGFDCLTPGPHTVHDSPDGLYVDCKSGRHYLEGQLDFDTNTLLVGLSNSNAKQ